MKSWRDHGWGENEGGNTYVAMCTGMYVLLKNLLKTICYICSYFGLENVLNQVNLIHYFLWKSLLSYVEMVKLSLCGRLISSSRIFILKGRFIITFLAVSCVWWG